MGDSTTRGGINGNEKSSSSRESLGPRMNFGVGHEEFLGGGHFAAEFEGGKESLVPNKAQHE